MSIEWRPVVGYEGLYEVGNNGTVRRLTGDISYQRVRLGVRQAMTRRVAGGVMSVDTDRGGYHRVFLCRSDGGRNRLVHQLVAQSFLGPCPQGCEINHIDGIKTNNQVENLEYVTKSQNLRHAVRVCGKRGRRGAEMYWNVKLTADEIPVIRAARLAGERADAVAARYGVTKWTIYAVCAGRSWKHL